jgi:hypothetical protein
LELKTQRTTRVLGRSVAKFCGYIKIFFLTYTSQTILVNVI